MNDDQKQTEEERGSFLDKPGSWLLGGTWGAIVGMQVGRSVSNLLGVAAGIDYEGMETIAEVAGGVGMGAYGYKWGKGADENVGQLKAQDRQIEDLEQRYTDLVRAQADAPVRTR